MEPSDFISRIPNFDSLSHPEKIRLFAWFLHTYKGIDIIDNGAIRNCYRSIGSAPPDASVYLPRMAAKKPPELVRAHGGYKLEGALARSLTAKYGQQKTSVAVTTLLSDLPSKIPDLAERAFLSETLDCYRVGAFRAAIVMAWNLAFDHLLRWIESDVKRLSDFNAAIPLSYPKKKVQVISRREDFEEFKEAEIIEICRTAKLCSKNTIEVLREKLKRRNAAAHPSQLVIGQHQADDVVTDLINNVVLSLS